MLKVTSPSLNRPSADLVNSTISSTTREFKPAGTSQSIFSLVATTLGAGTLTFGYQIKENGIVWGIILILFGLLITYCTGIMLVKASSHTDCYRYEDIALGLYGKSFATFTAVMNLLCLLAITISYIVYLKDAVPKIILIFAPDLDSFIVN